MKKFLVVAIILANFAWLPETKAQTATIRPIIFPVIGAVSYWDDFGAPRVGHAHKGNDLMGRKMLPLVSAVDGIIRDVDYPEPSYGYNVTIEDSEGFTYHYIHMNNDTPGTDNGKGDGINAYAVDIKPGNRIIAGQLVGWMGDSGNAETTTAHLHFEIRKNGEPFSPYASLQAATKITKPVDYPALPNEVLPFGNFTGGAAIAVGNLDADSDPEIVMGARAGGGPHVQVFDRGSQIAKLGFFPYPQTFRGGVDVAVGDVDGDGVDEIITAAGKGGGPNIKIFKADGTEIGNFVAYEGFNSGINVTAADMNNDGKAEIITAPAASGGPHVKIFNKDGSVVGSFMAYTEGFKGGIDVAASKGVIVTSPNTGGGPHIKTFDSAGIMQSEFLAYADEHRGGVRVSVSNSQIITAPLLGGPDFRKFDLSGNKLDSGTGFEIWWPGSWDVATYHDITYVSTGPNTKRRTSVRELDFGFAGRHWFENVDAN